MANAKQKCKSCPARKPTDQMIKIGLSYYCDSACLKSQSIRKAKPRKAIKAKARPKLTKIRASAQGKDCTARIPGICKNRTETTVLSHKNGGGSGTKCIDPIACYCCFECHSWLDGGYVKTHTTDQRDLLHAEAIFRTLPQLIELGLVIIP